MSKHQRPPMSATYTSPSDDQTILMVSRALRNGQPFFLGQGGNGRVVHIAGEHVAQFVDAIFADMRSKQIGAT